eukprot:4338597-Pleurochrysis_carterae.AAC.2
MDGCLCCPAHCDALMKHASSAPISDKTSTDHSLAFIPCFFPRVQVLHDAMPTYAPDLGKCCPQRAISCTLHVRSARDRSPGPVAKGERKFCPSGARLCRFLLIHPWPRRALWQSVLLAARARARAVAARYMQRARAHCGDRLQVTKSALRALEHDLGDSLSENASSRRTNLGGAGILVEQRAFLGRNVAALLLCQFIVLQRRKQP